MALTNADKLEKFLQKAATSNKKGDQLAAKIIKASELPPITFIPTGIDLFDAVIGGFPRGRFTLVYGGEGVAKTTLMLKTAGTCQTKGMGVVIMEPENRADKVYWNRYLDMDKIFISQAAGLGACLDTLIKIAESGHADLIVVDSLAALAVKELRGKGVEGDHMALMARRLPQFFQTATEIVANTNTAVVLIHQKRDAMDMYASELETYSGGNHLRHQVSLVLNMRRASAKQDPDAGERFKAPNGAKTGFMDNVKCLKGTVGTIPEGKSIQLDFTLGCGFDNVRSVAMFALRHKIMEKVGPGRYRFVDNEGEYVQHGLTNIINDMNDNKLRARVLVKCTKFVHENVATVTDVSPDLEYEASVISSKDSSTIELDQSQYEVVQQANTSEVNAETVTAEQTPLLELQTTTKEKASNGPEERPTAPTKSKKSGK